MKGSLSCWFFILTVLVLIMGGERSDEVRKGFVLNFKKKISLKHLVFRFQAINHCFRSKIPIVTDPFWANISKFRLFLQKMKFLFLANGEQQKQSGEGGLQERRRVVKRSAFLSHLLPCFPGPLIESGIPSPWLLKGVHSSQRAGCHRWPEVRWSSLTAGLALQQSSGEEDSISYMCSPKIKKGGVYTKPSKNHWSPLKCYVPFKGSIVFHQVMHSAYTSC